MVTILIYGFIAIVIMLIYIFHRLGKILDNSNDISEEVSVMRDRLDNIDNNTNPDYQREREDARRKI